MHRLLRGYYGVEPDAFKAFASAAVIVPDTNVLLNFYRVGESAQNDLFSMLNWAKDRLWVPFTVALEFQRNRQKVRAESIRFLEEASDKLSEALQSVKAKLDNIRPRDSRDELQAALQGVENSSQGFLDTIRAIIKAQSPASADSVRQRLDDLLSGCVADPLSKEELEQAINEARQRFEAKIPPGYLDGDKKDIVHLGHIHYESKYGDFLIWYEIRRRVRADAKSLILLSDDKKDDWWHREGGKTFGPRPELFADLVHHQSGVEEFAIYPMNRFLELIKSNGLLTVADETIADIAEPAPRKRILMEEEIVRIVADWLGLHGYEVNKSQGPGPDLHALRMGADGEVEIIGIEITFRIRGNYLRSVLQHAKTWIKQGIADKIVILFISEELADSANALSYEMQNARELAENEINIGIAFGTVACEESPQFQIVDEFGEIRLTSFSGSFGNSSHMDDLRSALRHGVNGMACQVELSIEPPHASSDPDVASQMASARSARIRAGYRVAKLLTIDEHDGREPILEVLVDARQSRELIGLGAVWAGPSSLKPSPT